MLELFARHSLVDLAVACTGDLHVDGHHTTEDVGICLGQAIDRALGDRAGIRRYGHAVLPMDETLVTAAVDLGGRPYWVWDVTMPTAQGRRRSTASWSPTSGRRSRTQGRMNLHVILHHGRNTHHVSEAIFKAAARALRAACETDPRMPRRPLDQGNALTCRCPWSVVRCRGRQGPTRQYQPDNGPRTTDKRNATLEARAGGQCSHWWPWRSACWGW